MWKVEVQLENGTWEALRVYSMSEEGGILALRTSPAGHKSSWTYYPYSSIRKVEVREV